MPSPTPWPPTSWTCWPWATLFTELHEPSATHLDLLRAFAGDALLERAYAEVRQRGYLWHEFGDAMVITGRADPSELSGPR